MGDNDNSSCYTGIICLRTPLISYYTRESWGLNIKYNNDVLYRAAIVIPGGVTSVHVAAAFILFTIQYTMSQCFFR